MARTPQFTQPHQAQPAPVAEVFAGHDIAAGNDLHEPFDVTDDRGKVGACPGRAPREGGTVDRRPGRGPLQSLLVVLVDLYAIVDGTRNRGNTSYRDTYHGVEAEDTLPTRVGVPRRIAVGILVRMQAIRQRREPRERVPCRKSPLSRRIPAGS